MPSRRDLTADGELALLVINGEDGRPARVVTEESLLADADEFDEIAATLKEHGDDWSEWRDLAAEIRKCVEFHDCEALSDLIKPQLNSFTLLVPDLDESDEVSWSYHDGERYHGLSGVRVARPAANARVPRLTAPRARRATARPRGRRSSRRHSNSRAGPTRPRPAVGDDGDPEHLDRLRVAA